MPLLPGLPLVVEVADSEVVQAVAVEVDRRRPSAT